MINIELLSVQFFIQAQDWLIYLILISTKMNGRINASKSACRSPYFIKTDTFDMKSNTYKQYQQNYSLLSIAKNNLFSVDIYQYYFSSIYTKAYYKEAQILTKLDLQHISRFFTLFMDIVMLRALAGTFSNLGGLVNGTLNDMINTQTVKAEDRRLTAFIKAYINEGYEGRFRQIALPKDMKNKNYFDSARAIEEQIDNLLKELKTELDDPIRFNFIKEREVLPNKLSDKEAVRYIKRNFESICNIQVLRKSLKKEVWDEFYEIVKGHISIIIGLIRETVIPTPEVVNSITMPKYSSQRQPILTPLRNHLGALQRSSQTSQAVILAIMGKNIVQMCNNYHRNTKHFLPNFSINDIFMDQKSLQLGMSFDSLLIDAIGFRNSVSNFELRIATEATALGLNFQETYLQTVRDNKILLNRKYYNPRKTGNINDENEEENEAGLKKQFFKEELLQEQIHVWRVINLIYFIQNGRHFANDYYQGNVKGLQQIQATQGFTRPFYMKHYQEMLKEIYQKLKAGILTFKTIIPFPQLDSTQKVDAISQQKSKLIFNSLKDYYEITDKDDSLFQNLKSQKFREKIYERYWLIKEITALITHTVAFKKLKNPQKYLLLHFFGTYEEAQYLQSSRERLLKLLEEEKSEKLNKKDKLSQKNLAYNEGARAKLKLQLQKQVFKINLNKQLHRKKKNALDTYNKLIDYQTRNDYYGQYMKKNMEYFQAMKDTRRCIQSIDQYLKIQIMPEPDFAKIDEVRDCLNSINLQLLKKQADFQPFYTFFANQREMPTNKISESTPKFIQDLKSYSSSKIEVMLNTVLMQLRNLLKSFIQSQIQPSLIKSDKLHECPESLKNNKKKWLQMCNYFNVKFRALTRAFLYLDDSTFMIYRSIFRNNLIEEKLSGPKLNAEKIDDLPITFYTARLQLILEKI